MELIDRRCSQCNFYKCNVHTFPIKDFSQQILNCACSLMDYIWKNKNRKTIEIFINLLLLNINDKEKNNFKSEQQIEKLIGVIFSEKEIILLRDKEISSNVEDIKKNNKSEKGEALINDNYFTFKIIKSWLKENLNSISLNHLNFILNKLNWYLQCLMFASNELLLKELDGGF
ncbi:hypothetical protein PIROE2DRAFT_9070 [Piromyces sp. E2]|nr:hypothetical protein PIROE2DRAFT_9070 [Piromyces sp. E2]|eukprot:OUM64228.1 hypothetical protein PIROE2DRAFT_9070 [Piromyces sp. E2]